MTASGHQQPTPRAPPRRVLEDASGRRLRRLRWVGRATALLFLVWLATVILGGLGVGPGGRLPLGNALRPTAGPPPLRETPVPVAPAAADLVPAQPAPASERAAVTAPPTSATPGKSATAPGQVKKQTTTPPTATTTTPGKSGAAPGHTKTSTSTSTLPGKSGVAPGRLKRKTTTAPTTTAVTPVPGEGRGRGKKP